MLILNLNNIDALLRGASLLSCGGGLAYASQSKLLQKPNLQSTLGSGIKLLEIGELQDSDICVTLSEVGSASAPVMDKMLLPKALQEFERQTSMKVHALIPGEIGQEMITLEAAVILGLPVINTDLAGCRSVPRLSDISLVVQGQAFTMSPLVILHQDGKFAFLPKQSSLRLDEQLVRSSVPEGEVVSILGAAIDGKTIKQFLNFSSYSKAIAIGEALQQNKELSAVLPTSSIFPPCKFKVSELKVKVSAGFSDQEVLLKSESGLVGVLQIENEYMQLSFGKEKFAFPELIMIFNEELRRGLHSSELFVGQELVVVVADAFDFWK